MTRYLVAVGGTGQHIALAITRLVALGALRDDIELIALDADTQTPLPRKLEHAGGIQPHPLKRGTVFPPFDLNRLGDRTFSQLFLDPDHPRENALFEAMFSSGAGTIPVSKGMYGTPSVGATVFADGWQSAQLQTLLRPLQQANEVFFAGSVVGGTGAGVIHKLVSVIRDSVGYRGPMFGLFFLPWFTVAAQASGENDITQSRLLRNAQHGLRYFYEHTIPHLQASSLLGNPGDTSTGLLRPVPVGSGDMTEKPHFLHVCAAYSLAKLPEAHTANRDTRVYSIVHDDAREGWLLDLAWENTRLNPNGALSLRHLIRAQRMTFNLLDFLAKCRSKILDWYGWGTVKQMTIPHTWPALHESIKNNTPGREQWRPYAEQVLEELARIQGEVQFCTQWAEQIFSPKLLQIPNDQELDQLTQESKRGAESPVHWPFLNDRVWRNRSVPKSATGYQPAAYVARQLAHHILETALGH